MENKYMEKTKLFSNPWSPQTQPAGTQYTFSNKREAINL